MTTPKYFSYLPNVHYALSANKAGQIEYAEMKDFFRLATIRDDIFREDTIYTKYSVKNGARPDQISYELYGDEQYYWILLQINEITDYYNQWPLSDKELDEYVSKKYGTNGASEIHHYETVETFDSAGNLVLPGGLQVPEDFVYTYFANGKENQTNEFSNEIEIANEDLVDIHTESGQAILAVIEENPSTPSEIGGTVYLTSLPLYVTNIGYERSINDDKSEIFALKEKYIQDYVREYKNYGRNVKSQVSFISIDDITP
jgi:hypothetical protein